MLTLLQKIEREKNCDMYKDVRAGAKKYNHKNKQPCITCQPVMAK